MAASGGALDQVWTLDALGNWDARERNLLSQTRIHNKANEITEVDDDATSHLGHDGAGDMTQGPRPGNETTRQHYVWDAWNRLVAVYADDGGSPGDLIVTYAYDGLHRRIRKVVEGDPDVTYDYYYNESWQVVEVRQDSDADPLEQYVWDVRYIDAPVVRFLDGNTDGDLEDEGDSTLYYCNDANMNVTALVNASGAMVERYQYDPYGKVTILDGTTGGQTEWATDADQVSDVANDILYCGYRFDSETGLYHVRHRYYHPTLGRWTARDPGSYGDGVNLYEYVAGSPGVSVDPLGLSGKSCLYQSRGRGFAVPESWILSADPPLLPLIYDFVLNMFNIEHDPPSTPTSPIRVDYRLPTRITITIKVARDGAPPGQGSAPVLTIPDAGIMNISPTWREAVDIMRGKKDGYQCVKRYHCEQPCRKQCCDPKAGGWEPPVDYTAVGKETYDVLGTLGPQLVDPVTGLGGPSGCIIDPADAALLQMICDKGLCGDEAAASQGP